MNETIFAVSSGAPPAAIAIIRVSGPAAAAVARTLAGGVPDERLATLRRLRDAANETLDHALVLWFPAPASATGEDVLELHVHGGRAVIAAVERAIAAVPGTRRAEPGEFTRRALLAGRIDLAAAAGLADLLEAETEAQRRAALVASEGGLARELSNWLTQLSQVRAVIEAAIDYDEDGDVPGADSADATLAELDRDLQIRLAAPTAERVREGWRVVIAGPPNAGKSSLFNAMLGRDVAIVTPIAGTTRDSIEARLVRDGQLFTLIDTAGLAEWTDDVVEREGMRRSREVLSVADLVLWVADIPPPEGARAALWLRGRSDESGRGEANGYDLAVSSRLPATVHALWARVIDRVGTMLSAAPAYLLQEDQWAAVLNASEEVRAAVAASDLLMRAEHLRRAAMNFTALLRLDPTESMLDAMFARFCVGK